MLLYVVFWRLVYHTAWGGTFSLLRKKKSARFNMNAAMNTRRRMEIIRRRKS